jgi:dTDP-glucose 4,6-dehydratase
MLEITISGTQRTLEFAKRAGATRFLLTSSGAVYGAQPPELYGIPESYPGHLNPMDPKNAYAIGKLASEHLCRHFASQKMACLIARCFALVGPGLPLNQHFAIGNFIGDALARRKMIIKGDGTPYRSYLYPTDLMIQLLAILVRGASCDPYNVGHPEAVSIRQTAEAVGTLTDTAFEILGVPEKGARAVRYVPNVEKVERLIGDQRKRPLRSLNASIQSTLQWHRELQLS